VAVLILSLSRSLSFHHPRPLSRRGFLARTGLCAAALCNKGAFSILAAEKFAPPIVVFSKVYQELNLNFEESAAITAEAGLDGVDCPVRPGGQILPERAAEDLRRFAEVLARAGLRMPLITTAITSITSTNAADVVRTAKKVGAQFYRLGFSYRQKDVPVQKQFAEIRPQLKDLADLNKTIGITGLIQNHSGQSFLGGDLSDLRQMVSGLDPAHIGVAFDIGHALIVHGDEWRTHFEQLKSHLKIAYVKDAKRPGGWVPFGEGDVGRTDYFKRLKQMDYQAPISMHIEFDWSEQGKSKTRPTLLKALRESSRVLKQWLAQA